MTKAKTHHLRRAYERRNDEYYTAMADVEAELKHYSRHFKGKVVHCNCDDYRVSNFYKYFKDNFHTLGLKKLIATGYRHNACGIYAEYDGSGEIVGDLIFDGDFRSSECRHISHSADMVVTNPPFSLFRQYIAMVFELNIGFLAMGPFSAVVYRYLFDKIVDGGVIMGINNRGHKVFTNPDGEQIKSSHTCWFSNINHGIKPPYIKANISYDPKLHKRYDNTDAIHLDKIANMPYDYDGVMGVPITFIPIWNRAQFEVLGAMYGDDGRDLAVDGWKPYCRVLIRRK